MKVMRLTVMSALCFLLAACGGGGTAQPPQGDVVPIAAPPGTSTTQVLVAPATGADVETIAQGMGATVLGPVPGTSYYRVSVPDGQVAPDFAHRMRGDHRVDDVEQDWGMSAPEGDGSTLPAGGLLIGSMVPVQPELLRIGAEVARARAAGRGVRVAVVDSGILPHEQVDANVDPDGWDLLENDSEPTDEPDGLDTDGDGLVDESYGHGLFVASLVIAIAPEVRIVPLRVLDADGIGSASVISEAIARAVDIGVQVVNLSVGIEQRVGVLEDAIRHARERGVVVVMSAGNTGSEDVSAPVALESAFVVTAVDETDVLAPFASYGREVDLAAPGVDLHGAYPSDIGTARWSGTSFSAALVSGAFALLRELDPASPAEMLMLRLATTSAPYPTLDPHLEGLVGGGRLDLDAATAP